MNKIALLVTVAAMAGSFGVGHALGQLQRQRASLSLEGITGNPSAIVTPKPSAVDASRGVPPGWSLTVPPQYSQPQKVVLRYESGGLIDEHYRRFNGYAVYGQQVEVRGHCVSACTIVMITVSRDHLCFDRNGALLFHLAQHADSGEVNMQGSLWLYRRYPADIRAWIDAMGGMESMPSGQNFWRLPAEKLWAMGYRRCAD
jgi:hypothetical protein